ncbi:di-trans,poly-cis-decaprenylcistransferase [Candidatus Woesearchaeota archaeon]|nr:di-trans,poly-cis-decaprenylcistransferase [Candidatus Woesearchaeota archaeon]
MSQLSLYWYYLNLAAAASAVGGEEIFINTLVELLVRAKLAGKKTQKAGQTGKLGNPGHIAVILDGNRRFAKRLMLKPWMGHQWGREKVEKLLDWCAELGIKELTLYAFSVDNFSRPKEEFDYIMRLFREACKHIKSDSKLQEKGKRLGIKVRFLGRLEMFPEDIRQLMREIMEKSSNNTGLVVNFCMAYGGRQEIADAAKMMAADVQDGKLSAAEVNDDTFKKYLYMPEDPDLIIRTGGEKRLSGFLLYQSSYSELFFLEKMWPEFEKEDLVQVIEEYRQRERRFGR